jgi:hypothetical protein
MMTREEFEQALSAHAAAQANYSWNASIEPDDEYTVAAKGGRDQALAVVLAVYDAQAALIAELGAMCEELADEVEGYVKHQYGPSGTEVHPALKSRYERDMDLVRQARELLSEEESQ